MTLDGMRKKLFSLVHFNKGNLIASILCRSRDLEWLYTWLNLAYGYVPCFTFVIGSEVRSSRFIMQHKMNVILHQGRSSISSFTVCTRGHVQQLVGSSLWLTHSLQQVYDVQHLPDSSSPFCFCYHDNKESRLRKSWIHACSVRDIKVSPFPCELINSSRVSQQEDLFTIQYEM